MTLDTIQDLIDTNHKLWSHCESCGRHHLWDLNVLGRKLGFDHSYLHPDIVPKLKCGKCGSKGISITISPPTSSANPMAQSSN